MTKKFDSGENSKKLNEDESSININYKIGKETLRKIDITLTESSDRSESTSSEIRTENLNSDNEINGNNMIPYNMNYIHYLFNYFVYQHYNILYIYNFILLTNNVFYVV